jgi:hypothetical protein
MYDASHCWPWRQRFRLGLLPVLCCALLVVFTGSCSQARESRSSTPATAAEAAKVLDLSTLPPMPGTTGPRRQNLAGLSYDARGTVKSVFEFLQKQLIGLKWQELPNSYVSDQSSNASFSREGFTLSLSVTPASEPGFASVILLNHGNIDLGKLPVPAGATESFVGSAIAMFVTETPVAVTTDAVRKLLLEKGWEPYGTAGDSQFFKQNAIQLTATVSAAPAQGGKTMISYSSLLMSVDLPAPADTIGLQYSDVTTQLLFDTKSTISDVVAFYRSTLAKAGWEATTDKPFQIDSKDMMIFRNPQHDMLTLKLYEVEGINRVILQFQSAAEIAEIERQVKAEAEREKAAREKP